MEYFFGTRGLLCGRVVHFVAEEATGKSSMIYLMYGMTQRTSQAWDLHYETESAIAPPDFVYHLGCDPTKVLFERPHSVDECLTAAEEFVKTVRKDIDPQKKLPIIVGIDSVSGLASGEMNMDTGETETDASLGKHARAFAKFFREKLDYFEYNDAVILSSAQLKANINTDVKKGGNPHKKHSSIAEGAFKYHASFIVEMNHYKLEENGVNVGERVRMIMTKNKLAPKNRIMELELYRDRPVAWDFNKANTNLLFSCDSPFKPGTFTAVSGWYKCDAVAGGKNMRGPDFVDAFYSDTALVMECRERLKIRGFGFKFETDYELPTYDTEVAVETPAQIPVEIPNA
jgi:RecA/RadA recombinase